MQVNPTQTIPPQLCICLLNELILTFLKTHLPLSQLQRERIDPAPLRKMHPSPRSHRQPSGPLEEAQAKVQGVVLGATEDASRSALDPSSGATAPLPTGACINLIRSSWTSSAKQILSLPLILFSFFWNVPLCCSAIYVSLTLIHQGIDCGRRQ